MEIKTDSEFTLHTNQSQSNVVDTFIHTDIMLWILSTGSGKYLLKNHFFKIVLHFDGWL